MTAEEIVLQQRPKSFLRSDAVPDPADTLLEARGLTVEYGQGPSAVRAVDAVDLTLRRGEFLGIAGESGSGKSTLAYGMTRLLAPPGVITSGSVDYRRSSGQHVDILQMTHAQLRAFRWSEVAIVFQSAMNALNPVLTIGAQLTDAIRAHRPRTRRAERTERAAELLRLVGINPDRLRSHPHQLSGGMRQRAMIAMALALEPDIIIMDEPTTALDVVVQRRILDKVADLREQLGFSVIFITHDLSLLIEMADTIAIMYASRIIEHAPAAELAHNPKHPYTHRLLHSFPPLHGPRRDVASMPGSPPDLAALPAGCAFHPRCPYAFDTCRSSQPPLQRPATNESSSSAQAVACWLHVPASSPPSLPPELAPQSSAHASNNAAAPKTPPPWEEGNHA